MPAIKYHDPADAPGVYRTFPIGDIDEVWVGPTAPTDPAVQLWYDQTTSSLKVKISSSWVVVSDLTQTQADTRYVNTTGDVMSGNLEVTPPSGVASVVVHSQSSEAAIHTWSPPGQYCGYYWLGGATGATRWWLGKSNDAEGVGNTGADLWLARYENAGAFIDVPIGISRATGRVMVNGDPTAALHVATKQYVDAKQGGTVLPYAQLRLGPNGSWSAGTTGWVQPSVTYSGQGGMSGTATYIQVPIDGNYLVSIHGDWEATSSSVKRVGYSTDGAAPASSGNEFGKAAAAPCGIGRTLRVALTAGMRLYPWVSNSAVSAMREFMLSVVYLSNN